MDTKEIYNVLVRPGFVDNIKKIGIDAVFSSAKGNYLYYNDDHDKVFDFICGYGTAIVGHNHPRLIEYAKNALEKNTVFQGQRSVRKYATILAARLNEILKGATGKEFVFQFGNSGAEANEIALKHALMEKKLLDDTILKNVDFAESVLSQIQDAHDRAEIEGQIKQTKKVLAESKVLVGMVDGFHGKTTGTLKVSYASGIRFMLTYLEIRSVFIDTYNIEDLILKSSELEREIYEFKMTNGTVSSTMKKYTPIIAYFAEPILGDGGLIELQPNFVKQMREICTQLDVPLIFDEIQCGMGRTGKFLASEHLGVYADYYCFSKALGGAISKNSVCAITKKRFVQQFGFIHSSTYNEDDYSCGISCEVLDMLLENDAALIKRCGQKGEFLHKELLKVQSNYPELILEVRGKGLMQGFVIDNSLNNQIKEFIELQYINLVEGYLFQHGYRVATTLTSGAVIRLEPSALVEDEEILGFMSVLNNLGKIIQTKDYQALVNEVTGGGM